MTTTHIPDRTTEDLNLLGYADLRMPTAPLAMMGARPVTVAMVLARWYGDTFGLAAVHGGTVHSQGIASFGTYRDLDGVPIVREAVRLADGASVWLIVASGSRRIMAETTAQPIATDAMVRNVGALSGSWEHLENYGEGSWHLYTAHWADEIQDPQSPDDGSWLICERCHDSTALDRYREALDLAETTESHDAIEYLEQVDPGSLPLAEYVVDGEMVCAEHWDREFPLQAYLQDESHGDDLGVYSDMADLTVHTKSQTVPETITDPTDADMSSWLRASGRISHTMAEMARRAHLAHLGSVVDVWQRGHITRGDAIAAGVGAEYLEILDTRAAIREARAAIREDGTDAHG